MRCCENTTLNLMNVMFGIDLHSIWPTAGPFAKRTQPRRGCVVARHPSQCRRVAATLGCGTKPRWGCRFGVPLASFRTRRCGIRSSDFGLRISRAAPRVSLLALAFLAALAGCAVGPDYKRPTVDAPAAYRTAADAVAPTGTNAFADLGWWQVFQDPQLTGYIGEALTNNWDLKIAAARVLQAEAALKIARSQFFPNISAEIGRASCRERV